MANILFIKTLTGGTITLEVPQEKSVLELYGLVANAAKVPRGLVRLVFHGKDVPAANDKKVREAFPTGSAIHLVLTGKIIHSVRLAGDSSMMHLYKKEQTYHIQAPAADLEQISVLLQHYRTFTINSQTADEVTFSAPANCSLLSIDSFANTKSSQLQDVFRALKKRLALDANVTSIDQFVVLAKTIDSRQTYEVVQVLNHGQVHVDNAEYDAELDSCPKNIQDFIRTTTKHITKNEERMSMLYLQLLKSVARQHDAFYELIKYEIHATIANFGVDQTVNPDPKPRVRQGKYAWFNGFYDPFRGIFVETDKIRTKVYLKTADSSAHLSKDKIKADKARFDMRQCAFPSIKNANFFPEKAEFNTCCRSPLKTFCI